MFGLIFILFFLLLFWGLKATVIWHKSWRNAHQIKLTCDNNIGTLVADKYLFYVLLSFQSGGAPAGPLPPQQWPVPWERALSPSGSHAVSPCVTGALPTTGPTPSASGRCPRLTHVPLQRQREGARERAVPVQWRGGKWQGREKWGRAGALDGLKGAMVMVSRFYYFVKRKLIHNERRFEERRWSKKITIKTGNISKQSMTSPHPDHRHMDTDMSLTHS